MTDHRQLNLPPVPVQTTDPARTTAGPADGPVVVPERTDGLSLLIQAVRDSGCAEKDVWLSLGLPDASYWSKVKAGEKPAPRISKLTDLPEATQRALCQRWARQLGLRVSDADVLTRASINAVRAAADLLDAIA